MRSGLLTSDLATERARAIKLLLRSPLLDVATDADGFRLVVRHHEWLTDWFETTCGWPLAVDPAAGFARLGKRPIDEVDVSRPLRRHRGSKQPFDRRRYQLLCLAAAELVQHPVTTIGLLAQALTPYADLDTSRHGERTALVDALRTLISWGAVQALAGDVDDFLASEQGNAVLHAETARLHRLVASITAPSSLHENVGPLDAIRMLSGEPRYGDREATRPLAEHPANDTEQRLRWIRHSLGRRLLDNPVVYYDHITVDERDYLDNPAGRGWLRARAAEAGFELEERLDGMLGIDPSGLSTDIEFPGPHGNAHQLALLLVDELLERGIGDDPARRPTTLTAAQVKRSVDAVFDRFPKWAKSQRDAEGRRVLTDHAVDLLQGFGLARRAGTEDLLAALRSPAIASATRWAPPIPPCSTNESDTMTTPLTAVPAMPADRWRPTRAGLLSVWRYVEEVFEFHRGRLLLRGPNGSGKSMALELLLPFLLDADASPNRLTSAARSRGGLFDRVMTGSDEPSRTGYVWVEFRRGNEIFTLGARMRASTSTRTVDTDYFTTSQAIGHDLQLIDEQRLPLSLKDLRLSIGDRGRVHGTSAEHRSAVRETLFEGFSVDRYESVVTALLALRKEKLSQNLDLTKLSDVLSEALPPIDDHDIAAVAEGFERLDRRRTQLDALRTDVAVVEALDVRQRGYARAVIAWLADEVRSAESTRDTVTRRVREAAEQLDAERTRLSALELAIHELDDAVSDTGTQIDALVRSDAYREGANLADLRNQLGKLDGAAQRAQVAFEKAELATKDAARELDGAIDRHRDAIANLDQAQADLRQAASAIGAEGLVADAADLASERDTAHDAEALVRAYTSSRADAIDEVRGLLRVHEEAVHQREFHGGQAEDDIRRLDQPIERRREALEAVDVTVQQYGALVGTWASSCSTIDIERLQASLPEPATEPALVDAALATLRAALQSETAVACQQLKNEQQQLDVTFQELQVERGRYASGTLVEPERPSRREDRGHLPGAPLWRLVDVAVGVPSDQLDGVEAALLASGLVDAWVQPDGSVEFEPGRADVTLTADPIPGTTLATVLRPLRGTPVDPAIIASVLSSIELVPSVTGSTNDVPHGSRVSIGYDGTFQLGAAFGRGRTTPATLLGAEVRERRRIERLGEFDAEIENNRRSHRTVGHQIESLERLRLAHLAELDAAPGSEAVDEARGEAKRADERKAFAEERLATSREQVRVAEESVRTALRRLTTIASRHDVPTDAEALDNLGQALKHLDDVARTWGTRWREQARSLEALDREESSFGRVRSIETDAAANLDAAQRDHHELVGTVEALASTVGQGYDEVLARLERLREQRSLDQGRLKTYRAERPEIDKAIGGLETTVQQAEEARANAEQERIEVHRRFATAAERGLATDAGIAVTTGLEGVTAVLGAARSVAGDLHDVNADQPARDRLSGRVEEHLHQTRQQLGGRVDLDRAPTDDGWSDLTALTGGIRRRVGDLAAALRSELDSATSELKADEEQLFARVLAGDIRRALAERIRHANDLVGQINEQLDQVRTQAGGVQVRLGWDVDPEQLDAVRSARALLLRDPGNLTDSEASALQTFVRARVEQARAELEMNAPWEARLRETLDYRAWHRFTLQIAHRDWEGYRPATLLGSRSCRRVSGRSLSTFRCWPRSPPITPTGTGSRQGARV